MVGHTADLLVCQETLAPLKHQPGGLWSETAQRLYPIRDGLVYMGYPAQDEQMITATMREEHAWQGTTNTLERDIAFLRQSTPLAVRLINLASCHITTRQPRALELGSGSGWVSWLLARAGYDTYMIDFEPNSLTLGLNFQHPGLGTGHRIVADARYAPFPDGTFDLVLFKEFVHHVADYKPLFIETCRVLKPGGVVALMEPTMSVWKRAWQVRHPDPHEGHHIEWPHRYLRALHNAGLKPVHVTSFYGQHEPRNPVVRAAKRAAASRAAGDRHLDWLLRAHLTMLGGAQLVVIARKVAPAVAADRPAMRMIDPDGVSVDDESFDRYAQLLPIVTEAAKRLVAVAEVEEVAVLHG